MMDVFPPQSDDVCDELLAKVRSKHTAGGKSPKRWEPTEEGEAEMMHVEVCDRYSRLLGALSAQRPELKNSVSVWGNCLLTFFNRLNYNTNHMKLFVS